MEKKEIIVNYEKYTIEIPDYINYLTPLLKNDFQLEFIDSNLTEEERQIKKQKETKNLFCISGSKSKTFANKDYLNRIIQCFKKEELNKSKNYFAIFGVELEDYLINEFIKNFASLNISGFKNKFVVVDKRRRILKGNPLVSYELDGLIYTLNDNISFDEFKKLTNINDSKIIDNTSGKFDEILEKYSTKYAVLDIKTTTKDIFETMEFYKEQLNYMSFFEKVDKWYIFQLNSDSKTYSVQYKNLDKTIVKNIFNNYDEYLDLLLNNDTFNKESTLLTSEKTFKLDDFNDLEIKENIQYLKDNYDFYKNYEKIDTLVKDYFKNKTKNNEYSDIMINYEINDEYECIIKQSKKVEKEVFNIKLLEDDLRKANVKYLVLDDGSKIEFNINNYNSVTEKMMPLSFRFVRKDKK